MKPVKTWDISVGALAVLLLGMLGAGASAQPTDALMGTWKLNVAKSKYSPGPAPKSGTLTYSTAGQGVKVVVDLVSATGEKVQWQYTANYDSKDYPITGNNPDADTAALKRIDAMTVEIANKKGGKPTTTNVRVLSKDGKTLTVTTKGKNAMGETVNNVQVFEKG